MRTSTVAVLLVATVIPVGGAVPGLPDAPTNLVRNGGFTHALAFWEFGGEMPWVTWDGALWPPALEATDSIDGSYVWQSFTPLVELPQYVISFEAKLPDSDYGGRNELRVHGGWGESVSVIFYDTYSYDPYPFFSSGVALETCGGTSQSAVPLELGVYHHITVVVTPAAGTAVLFVDGVPVAHTLSSCLLLWVPHGIAVGDLTAGDDAARTVHYDEIWVGPAAQPCFSNPLWCPLESGN